MHKMKLLNQIQLVLALGLLLQTHTLAGDDIIVIKAKRVITVSGEEYAPGIIVIEDGKITEVGSSIEYPPSAKIIKAQRETITPGFIHPRTRFGLDDYNRSGVNGDKSVSSEIYLQWMDMTDLLHAGFTSACFIPDGKDIAGMASIYRTAGDDSNRLVQDNAYLQIATRWGTGNKKMFRGALKKAKEEIEKVEKAQKEWDEKQKKKKEEQDKKDKEEKKENGEEDENGDKSIRSNDENGEENKEEQKEDTPKEEEFTPPEIDAKYQPLVDLIQKKEGARMTVQLTKASDLHHFDDVLEPYDDLAYSLYFATSRYTDYQNVIETLGERKAKIMIRPRIHFLPYTTFRYNLVAKLTQAGCEVSVVPWNDSRKEFQRIRSRLADMIRAGLSKEEAIKTLTLYPARAIGLDKRLGSIEKEKEADLLFFKGDPLDPHTKISRIMILGEFVWDAKKK